MNYLNQEYYHTFNIDPFSIVQRSFDFQNQLTFKNGLAVKSFPPEEVLTETFINKAKKIGLSNYLLVFGHNPGIIKPSIHQDIDSTTQQPVPYAFNVLISGQGSMKWFNPDGPGEHIMHPTNNGYANSIQWFNGWGDPLDTWNKDKVAMVRTDIPHQVFNEPDAELRCSVSIRFWSQLDWDGFKNWVYQQKDLFSPT